MGRHGFATLAIHVPHVWSVSSTAAFRFLCPLSNVYLGLPPDDILYLTRTDSHLNDPFLSSELHLLHVVKEVKEELDGQTDVAFLFVCQLDEALVH